MQGRTGALDLGAARIGVAIEDELGLYAHPRGTLDARNPRAMLRELRKLAAEENVVRFVVGLPLDMRGGEGEAARKVRDLAQTIANALRCEIELWAERLTTVQARRALAASEVHGEKAKKHIDEASAVTILQSWLDAKNRRRRSR